MKNFYRYLHLLLIITACSETPIIQSTVTMTNSPATTITVIPENSKLEPSSVPFLLIPTSSNTPTTLPITRQTPLSLMLHRSNINFDAVAFLQEFITIVQQNNLKAITYRKISENPNITATEQGNLIIFTIDDIYLRYPIDPSVKEMISMLKIAGFPAVLGIVTEGDYAYPETVSILKELSALGWEVASHSDTHRNLAEIQKISPKGIYPEIKISLDKLESALGQRPITLILPEGQMTQGDQQLKRTGVLWIVGINGGTTYKTDATYYYVGREGPTEDAAKTFSAMKNRFNQ